MNGLKPSGISAKSGKDSVNMKPDSVPFGQFMPVGRLLILPDTVSVCVKMKRRLCLNSDAAACLISQFHPFRILMTAPLARYEIRAFLLIYLFPVSTDGNTHLPVRIRFRLSPSIPVHLTELLRNLQFRPDSRQTGISFRHSGVHAHLDLSSALKCIVKICTDLFSSASGFPGSFYRDPDTFFSDFRFYRLGGAF